MAARAPATVSYDAYREAERVSDRKHEYRDGAIVAMSGGTIEHGRLGARLLALIGAALEGRRCTVLSSDVRIRVAATNRAFYPDGSVVCGTIDRATDDTDAITNPIVVIEVLSDSTEGYDRGEKARHYRGLTSLREYVLVSQSEQLVEVWEPAGRSWRTREHYAGEVVVLSSIDVSFAVDDLYRDPLRGDG